MRMHIFSRRTTIISVTAASLLLVPAIANLSGGIALSEVITVDFGVFMSSGEAVRSGANPYAVYIIWRGVGLPNLNPPPWLPLFTWLAQFDHVHAYNVWRVFNLTSYLLITGILLSVYRSTVTAPRVVWALAVDGLSSTLYNGQVYIVILMLLAAAWLCLERRANGWGGICIGIAVALKPNLGVLSALLLATGFWRLGLTSLIVAALAFMAPVLHLGTVVYRQWLAAAVNVTWLAGPGNASLWSFADHVRLSRAAVPLAAVSIIVITVLLRRRKADALTVLGTALPASLLLSPVSWSGYSVILMPVFLSRNWSWRLVVAAALLVIPSRLIDWWAGAVTWPFTILGSFAFLACLLTVVEGVRLAGYRFSDASESGAD